MKEDRMFNIIRGTVLAAGLTKEEKRQLLDFITKLEFEREVH